MPEVGVNAGSSTGSATGGAAGLGARSSEGGSYEAGSAYVASASSSVASSSRVGAIDGSTVTAMRISRPMTSLRASVTSGRSRVSSTSLVKSLGAASSAVSSTRPSGRVSPTKARCWGLRAPVDSEARARVQTSVRSRVVSVTGACLSAVRGRRGEGAGACGARGPRRATAPDGRRRTGPASGCAASTGSSTGCGTPPGNAPGAGGEARPERRSLPARRGPGRPGPA